MKKLRRTKIIATLGPALDDPEILAQAIKSGAGVFRANFSHGSAEDHATRINRVRDVAQKLNMEVTVFADLQGPKIRVASFRDGSVILKDGDEFVIDVNLAKDAGCSTCVGCDYESLAEDLSAGDILLLDDGKLTFKVTEINGRCVHCVVVIGGKLSNNKGINLQGGGLSAHALTDKDKADLITAIGLGVGYVAISFVRNANDVHEARELIKAAKGEAGIIAKIERAEAIPVIDEIIEASDVVMVARGDLAIEIGDAEVPGVQKHIIHRARSLNKVVITATQMMESMIDCNVPTRAEVSDVANAVLDNTDCVMLSAESAVGKYPVEAIAAMDRVCLSAENQLEAKTSRHRVECHFERPDEAIAMATMYTANHLNIAAIVSLTESGSTPLWMSRIRSSIPILALTRHVATLRRVNLYRGVYPIHFEMTNIPRQEINRRAADTLLEMGILQPGERIIITKGDILGVHGYTNSMKIFEI